MPKINLRLKANKPTELYSRIAGGKRVREPIKKVRKTVIKAPFFYLAVGSQANIGGAASAPIVAAAFHTSLASVGVLLAIFGYIIGTYGAILSALLMEIAAPK